MPFPPLPVYPKAIDSDYTLFQVYNTTETRLAADNSPWAQEIPIVPVAPDKLEIWANNGFANINGELLYYDSVELNPEGKVNKLKGCARQLGGKTQFNKKGTWIRSYVVAEHHNQLVECFLQTQAFIGYNFTPDMSTLDWRIRNLQALEVIFDDFACPDVDFTFNIIQDDPVKGVVAQYFIDITPPGSISSFRLDFGDGTFTTTALQGTHTYALNARIDPVITLSNDQCQIIQTPVERDNPAEPPPVVQEVFSVPIPEVPDICDFTFVPCVVPPPDINIPPLVVPCISIEGQVGPIPSVIVGSNINFVSTITLVGPGIPSTVTVTGNPIPSFILVEPPIPPTIIIEPPIPPTIVIVPVTSNITLDIDATELPRLEVDWGTPPNMEVAMTLSRPVNTPQKFATDPKLVDEFGTEFADLFDVQQTMQVQYEPVGIPSEINVIVPELKDFKIDHGDLFNKKIQIDSSAVNIPTNIRIHGPESPIPDSISLDASDLVEAIEMFKSASVKLDASDMPRTLKVEMEKTIPDTILVEIPKPIPERIIVESDIPSEIILIGPKSIPIEIPEGIGLPVIFPEKMPEVELVWRGPPIEVKVTMDEVLDKAADGRNCVMITPCPVK